MALTTADRFSSWRFWGQREEESQTVANHIARVSVWACTRLKRKKCTLGWTQRRNAHSQRTQKYGHRTVHARPDPSVHISSVHLVCVATDPGKFVVPFLRPKSPRLNPLKVAEVVAVAVVSLVAVLVLQYSPTSCIWYQKLQTLCVIGLSFERM